MFNWLTQLLDRIRYGEIITENYTGKVVRVVYVFHGCCGWEYLPALLTVMQDDGERFIAGALLSADWNTACFLDAEDGLHHTYKRNVTIIANSVDEWKEAERIRKTRKRYQQSVCSNEAEEVGIVTGYDGTTFTGMTLEGDSWESKEPRLLASSLKSYTAQ